MSETHHQHRTGIALVITAAFAWSTAPLFTRLLHYDSWTILFWRGLFGGGFIAAFLIVTQGRAGLRELMGMRTNGWLVAGLSTLAMVTFIPALQMTSVANVAIIIAAQPFAAAALAWIWFREAARLRTLLAALVALGGVAIIVSGAAGAADVRGRPRLPDDVCGCRDDSGNAKAPGNPDGGGGCDVQFRRQPAQYSFRSK